MDPSRASGHNSKRRLFGRVRATPPCHTRPPPRTPPPPTMHAFPPPRTTPLWTDTHLWKHNLRKLCLRAVKILAMPMSVTRWRCFSPWGLPRHKYILVKKDFSLKFLLKIFVEETFLFNFYQLVYIWSDHSYSIRMISSIADSEIAITGRAQLF